MEHQPNFELREAAAAARAQWRADEEAWTRVALESWEHGRTLIDVVRDHMHRGDVISVILPRRTLTGVVSAVGRDVMRIGSESIATDVRFAADTQLAVRVISRAHAGGSRGDPGLVTFRARLLELEVADVLVEAGAFGGDDVGVGRLRVGRDHVSIDGPRQGQLYLPMGSLNWIRPVDVD